MIKNINWGNVEASTGDFARPTPGGYVIQIIDAEDNAKKEYVAMRYDICSKGEFTDFYKKRFDASAGKYDYPKMFRSYKETARGMFKGFLKALEDSRNKIVADKFNGDEQQFVGMKVGVVLGEEEYIGNDGSTKTRLYVARVISAYDVVDGKFNVPEIKKLSASKQPATYTPFSNVDAVPDNELPF